MLEVVICGFDSGMKTDHHSLQDSICYHTSPVRTRPQFYSSGLRTLFKRHIFMIILVFTRGKGEIDFPTTEHTILNISYNVFLNTSNLWRFKDDRNGESENDKNEFINYSNSKLPQVMEVQYQTSKTADFSIQTLASAREFQHYFLIYFQE